MSKPTKKKSKKGGPSGKTKGGKGASRESVLRSKINSIKRKLQEMADYKAILAEDGAHPDMADKERESKLIVQLLRHEKELATLTGKPVGRSKPSR